jgi:N-(5-amino-5-carboxypentanoyl)-L-cysteinyl-D-valine synthase
MPPGEGGAESYLNNIVPGLKNKKLMIFNNFMNCNVNSNFDQYYTYEKLALDYICYIKSVQKNGPYNLFGWSFGGILAFEITRQLIEQGDIVRNLTIIDSYFNLRTAITKANINISFNEQGDINYKYFTLIKDKELISWQDINITLFKATKVAQGNDYNQFNTDIKPGIFSNLYYKINQHYVNNTHHNYLDIILDKKTFSTIAMPHSHTSWVDDKSQISQICSVI